MKTVLYYLTVAIVGIFAAFGLGVCLFFMLLGAGAK